MKSKMKYAALVLVIGLLGLVILPSSVFGGGPKTNEYHIIINIDGQPVAGFDAYGNKDGTRIAGFEKYQQGMVENVAMNFPDEGILPPDEYLYDPTDTDPPYPERYFRWSPLEENCWGLLGEEPSECSGCDELQALDNVDWEFHHIKISGNSLECRFDLFYDEEYDGAWDHYIIGINMEFGSPQVENNSKIYTGDATINWTHYTEWSKPPKGKKLDIAFQHLEYPTPGEPTITITITKL